jgi:hypothetical protein
MLWPMGLGTAVFLGLGLARADSNLERYRFSVAVRTSEMSVAASTMPAAQWQVAGTLSLGATHRYRDGSIGYRVSLDEVSEGGQPSPLQGRSFGFRTFEDGEILDMSDGAQIAGWRSRGDLIDLLVPLLSPAPPKKVEQGTGHRRLIWPVRVGTKVRWDNAVEADWILRADPADPEAMVLEYSGPYTLSGADKRPGGKLLLEGEGKLSGELRQHPDGRWSHRITLDREVQVLVGAAPPVIQQQQIVASISGDSLVQLPSLTGPAPAPRYLQIAQIQPVVQGAPAGMAACEPGQEALTLPVRLNIDGDGRVSKLEAGESPPCVQRALKALSFPSHDGPGLELRFTVYRRAGRFGVSPLVALMRQPVGPVLVHPLGTWPAHMLAAMSAALGHPIPETPALER